MFYVGRKNPKYLYKLFIDVTSESINGTLVSLYNSHHLPSPSFSSSTEIPGI